MKLYIPFLKKNGMKITGHPKYIGINAKFDDFNRITLGDQVVISDECHFLTHDYSYTTVLNAESVPYKKDIAIVRGITVGNNVFIGKKSIIMPNTEIGNNVIIGAGSVVRGNISPDSVYLGNPAKEVCTINELYQKWVDLPDEVLRKD